MRFFCLIFSLSLSAFAADRAVLKIDSPLFEFGQVQEGAKVAHQFVLQNTGTANLQIQKIVPSCGCTVADASALVIKPGTSEKISVEFDTSGFSGDKVRTIEVLTNDLDQQQISLTLKGRIVPALQFDQKRIDFGELFPGRGESNWVREFSIKVANDSAQKIEEVGSFSKFMKVSPVEVAPDRLSGRYRITLDPNTPKGDLRERVFVNLSGSRSQTVNLPVLAIVRGDLRINPTSVSLGVVSGKEPIERVVRLENRGKQAVKIVELVSSSDAISGEVKEIQAGKNFVLKIKADPQKIRSDLVATITVKTDHPIEKELVLNVFAVMPPN